MSQLIADQVIPGTVVVYLYGGLPKHFKIVYKWPDGRIRIRHPKYGDHDVSLAELSLPEHGYMA